MTDIKTIKHLCKVVSVAKNAGNSMIATKHPFTTPTAIPIKILIRIPTPVGSP